jgi:ferritin-like metal-binding protein YciE
MDSLTELLQDQLKDLYNAEKQLTKALPSMAKKASTPALKEAMTMHLEETKGQITRLEQIAQAMGFKPTGKTCKAMQGLIEEGKEVIAEKGEKLVTDAALIAAAQRVEHYEISAYGSARALAEQLGETEAVELLQETLDEEKAADSKLNTISLEQVLPSAPSGVEEEEDEEMDEEEPVAARPTRAAASKRGK